MDQETLAFLAAQRVSVISILQDDNTPHAATLHFAYDKNNNVFYFLTHTSSRKCQSLLSGKEMPASFVTGFSEEACSTFQADGVIRMLTGEPLEEGWHIYGKKYPERSGAKEQDGVTLLCFTPLWHRYSAVDVKKRFTS